MMDVSFLGAGLAGLLAFLSPCILPIVPFYLSYMAGVGMNQIRADAPLTPAVRWRAIVTMVAFSAGIVTFFMFLGLSATVLGQTFVGMLWWLKWVAAAVIFAMGLHFLGVIRIELLYRQFRADLGDTSSVNLLSAFIIGFSFAFGWTPCVGPVLGAILVVAAGSESLWRGVMLLFVFGAGMTLPFVVAAAFVGPFMRFMARFRRHLGTVEKIMGALLVVFAVLIATDSLSIIGQWMVERWPDDQTMWCSWQPGRFLWEMSGAFCLD